LQIVNLNPFDLIASSNLEASFGSKYIAIILNTLNAPSIPKSYSRPIGFLLVSNCSAAISFNPAYGV